MSALDYLGVAGAFLLSLALVWAALRVARARSMYDLPGHRSSHETPTPRIGGIGILLSALVVGTIEVVCGPHPRGGPLVVVAALAGGLVAGATGLADDVRSQGLRPRDKYLGQAAAACATVALLGWSGGVVHSRSNWTSWLVLVVVAALAILWQTALANFTNFMDGADGLVAGIGSIILIGYAAAGPGSVDGTQVYALICAGAALGFLVMNFPPARIFMGDGGSLFLGQTIAVAGIWVALPATRLGAATPVGDIGLESFVTALVLTAPLWVDPITTLAVRRRWHRRLSEAHRDHLYQRMIRRGATHRRVTLLYWGYAALCAGAVLVTRWLPSWGMASGIALVTFGIGMVLFGHRLGIAVESK